MTARDFCQTADRISLCVRACVCTHISVNFFLSALRSRHITGTPHSLRRLYFPSRRAKTFLKCRRLPRCKLSFNWPRQAHFGLSFPVQIYTSSPLRQRIFNINDGQPERLKCPGGLFGQCRVYFYLYGGLVVRRHSL